MVVLAEFAIHRRAAVAAVSREDCFDLAGRDNQSVRRQFLVHRDGVSWYACIKKGDNEMTLPLIRVRRVGILFDDCGDPVEQHSDFFCMRVCRQANVDSSGAR
jgi:hypothetical protein